jgi:hypothetical protein
MAFLIGLAAVPGAVGAYFLYDGLVPERACKDAFLGCLGEGLLAILAGCVLAGVLAQLSSRSVAGWPWLLLGLAGGVAAIAIYASGARDLDRTAGSLFQATLILSVPASVAYFVTMGVRRAISHERAGPSADARSTGRVAGTGTAHAE